MKKIIILSNILLSVSLICFCQETDVISEVPPLKKGEVILTDGTAIKYKNLSVSNDTVFFSSSQSMATTYSANDIYKISKTGNLALECAAGAGLGWMLGAWLGTMSWDGNASLEDSRNTYIFGGAAICAAIGGIIGALVKKERTIYKNEASIRLTPIGDFNIDNKFGLMLTCRISINKK